MYHKSNDTETIDDYHPDTYHINRLYLVHVLGLSPIVSKQIWPEGRLHSCLRCHCTCIYLMEKLTQQTERKLYSLFKTSV